MSVNRFGTHLRRSWRSASSGPMAALDFGGQASSEYSLRVDKLAMASDRLRSLREGVPSNMVPGVKLCSLQDPEIKSAAAPAPYAQDDARDHPSVVSRLERRRSMTGTLSQFSHQHPHMCNEYSPSEIIVKKRDGHQLSAGEIDWFVQGFHQGYVETYQMSAFLMAACTRGMTRAEATYLTQAMVRSGNVNDLSAVRPNSPKVDKHSSGGTGDKVSLILTPLVACFDVVVPMMSGRGLGHTGGTLDKLSSIAGLRTELSSEQYMRQLDQVGCAIVSPPAGACPVEKKIYRIRDVSGCVEDVGLVASSIMSKKLAERPDALLLDVKMGRGAFAKCLSDAAALANMMVSIGSEAGIETCCLITDMNSPLGSAVGNSLEVREAIHILQGDRVGKVDPAHGSEAALNDVRHLALTQAAVMLGLGGKAKNFKEGYAMASDKLASGAALHKFAEMVAAQGGDSNLVLNPEAGLVKAAMKLSFRAPEDVIVQDIDAFEIGSASTKLGAGRKYVDDQIDLHAGIILHAKVGEMVRKGDPIFSVMVGDDYSDDNQVGMLSDPQLRLREGFDRAVNGITIAPNRPEFRVNPPPLIEFFVDVNGMKPFSTV